MALTSVPQLVYIVVNLSAVELKISNENVHESVKCNIPVKESLDDYQTVVCQTFFLRAYHLELSGLNVKLII